MEYFSLKEVCKELAVSEATLKNWIKLNKISPINFANNTKNFVDEAVDNKIRFSKEYIIDFKKNLQSGKIDYLKSRRNKKSYICLRQKTFLIKVFFSITTLSVQNG